MKKRNTTLAILILATSAASAWAIGPCMPIAQACMKEGYYKGGEKVGKGLIKDCIGPIAAKQKTLTDTTFTDDQLQACQAAIAEKMQANKVGTQ